MTDPAEVADVLIIGAGTAGCVLASRLSENPGRRVVLIESGADLLPDSEPAEVLSLYPLSYFNPRYLWPNLQVRWSAGRGLASFSQGHGVGGGSTVMGMWAVRGFADDYDDWAASGAEGWEWEQVLPFFKRLERDLDFAGSMHGDTGFIPIRRQDAAAQPPFCRAISAASVARGLPQIADINTDFRDGVALLPIAASTTRITASAAYLSARVRARPNLRLITGARCTRILFSENCATGVEALRDGHIETLRSTEVISCAGALQSPTLLQRSGIGERSWLEGLGIGVIADRPGVGAHLQNHPLLSLGMHLRPHATQVDLRASAAFLVLRMSSGLTPRSDLYASVLNRSSWHYFGRRLATLGLQLHKPESRGQVRIQAADPDAPASVDFALLSAPADMERMLKGLRVVTQLLLDPGVRSLGGAAGLVRPGRVTRVFASRTRMARALDAALARILPFVPALEARLFDLILGDVPLERLAAASETQLAEWVRASVAGVFHPVGTCRMGSAVDRTAVVDSQGRVYGTRKLRVVDASIMPAIPRSGTFLPTVMLAEKIAAGFDAE